MCILQVDFGDVLDTAQVKQNEGIGDPIVCQVEATQWITRAIAEDVTYFEYIKVPILRRGVNDWWRKKIRRVMK